MTLDDLIETLDFLKDSGMDGRTEMYFEDSGKHRPYHPIREILVTNNKLIFSEIENKDEE